MALSANLYAAGRPDDGGRALVLVHGAGGTHQIWGPVHVRLRKSGIPAVALDLPGHGRSGGTGHASVDAYAAEIDRWAREAGVGSYVAAGHSLGGAIALTLGARKAEGIRGLGIVSAGALLPVDPMILRGTLGSFECTIENLARFWYARGTSPELLSRAVQFMAGAGPKLLHGDFTACSRYAMEFAALESLDVPVEVVCGEADVLTPIALSEELAARIPSAHLTRIPGVGHVPLLEAPGEVAEALTALWRKTYGTGRT